MSECRTETQKYDWIRLMPYSINRVHESSYKSFQILREVKRLLEDGVPSHIVLEIVKLLESNMPGETPGDGDITIKDSADKKQ